MSSFPGTTSLFAPVLDAGSRYNTAVSIMRAWMVRRRATRMAQALSTITQQFGAGSPDVVRAQAAYTTTQNHLRPLLNTIEAGGVTALVRPDGTAPPGKPAEFAGSDGLPDADWSRAWQIAGAMYSPTFGQNLQSLLTADNSFWQFIDSAGPPTQQFYQAHVVDPTVQLFTHPIDTASGALRSVASGVFGGIFGGAPGLIVGVVLGVAALVWLTSGGALRRGAR